MKQTERQKFEALLNGYRNDLDGSDYEQGKLEDLSDTQDKMHNAFAKLLAMLVYKKMLSVKEVDGLLSWVGTGFDALDPEEK